MPSALFDFCPGDIIVSKTKRSLPSRTICPLYAEFPSCYCRPDLIARMKTHCVSSFWVFSPGFPVGTSNLICRILKGPTSWECWCASAPHAVSASVKPPCSWLPPLGLQGAPHPRPVTWIWACFFCCSTSSGPQLTRLLWPPPWLQPHPRSAFWEADLTVALFIPKVQPEAFKMTYKAHLVYTGFCLLQLLCKLLLHLDLNCLLPHTHQVAPLPWAPALCCFSALWYSTPCPPHLEHGFLLFLLLTLKSSSEFPWTQCEHGAWPAVGSSIGFGKEGVTDLLGERRPCSTVVRDFPTPAWLFGGSGILKPRLRLRLWLSRMALAPRPLADSPRQE